MKLKKVLLVGATGTIGSEVLALLQKKGLEVIGCHRSSEPAVDITDPASIARLYQALGEIDAVVSAAGEAGFNRLDVISDEEIERSARSKFLGQVNLVRKGLSHLRPGGVFVITGGILAYHPLPQTSLIAAVNGALESFSRAVATELTEGRRIVTVHPDWVAETAAKLGMDMPGLPTAAETAQAYWNALCGPMNGEPVFVPGHGPKT